MCEVEYPPSEDPGLRKDMENDIKAVRSALYWLTEFNGIFFSDIHTLLTEEYWLATEFDGISDIQTLTEHRDKVNKFQAKVIDVAKNILKASVDSIRSMDGFHELAVEGGELESRISGELIAGPELRRQIRKWRVKVADAAKTTLKESVYIRNLDGSETWLSEAMDAMMPKAEGQQVWDDAGAELIFILLQNQINNFAQSDERAWEAKSKAALAKLVLLRS